MEPDLKSLRDRAAIVGIGEIPFVLGDSGKSCWAMGIEASYKAVQDAGLSVQDIDGHHGTPDRGLGRGFPAELGSTGYPVRSPFQWWGGRHR